MADIPNARIHKGVEFLENVVRGVLERDEPARCGIPGRNKLHFLSDSGAYLSDSIRAKFSKSVLAEMGLREVTIHTWSCDGWGVEVVSISMRGKMAISKRHFTENELIRDLKPIRVVTEWIVSAIEEMRRT